MDASRRSGQVRIGGPVALGTLFFLGLLVQCGGGDSSPPGSADAESDAEMADATPDISTNAEAGADGTLSEAESVDAPGAAESVDAPGEAESVDAPAEAGSVDAPSEAEPLEASSDGAGDGPVDSGVDAPAEAASAVHCDMEMPCTGPSSVQCCSGVCIDTAKDAANCGACGAGCTATQFCNGTQCNAAILANVCDNAKGTVSLDPYTVDNQTGIAMGNALTSSCASPPSIVQFVQTATGVLDPVTSRPITGVGNTFVAGGGSHGQLGTNYMETMYTSVYLSTDGTTAHIVRRSTGTDVVTTPNANLTASHDFFYVEVTVEPLSGTLCLEGAGIEASGTQAAGYYAATELIPNRATYTANWYVYEWTDMNENSTADQGDTFTLVGSGM